MMTATRPLPALRRIAHIEVHVAAPHPLGQLGGPERRIIPIQGGTFVGEGFSGKILPGGSDIQLVRDAGVIELSARYAIDLGAAGCLLLENTGIRRPMHPDAAPTDPAYFRGIMRFQAPAGPLVWLNDSIFITDGYRENNIVHLDVIEVQ